MKFDPSTRSFTAEELKPQPIVRKSRKVFVPPDNKVLDAAVINASVSAVARVSEAPPDISRGAPHTLLAYYYELQ